MNTMNEDSASTVSVEIPAALYAAAATRAQESGFGKVAEYLVFVLEELLAETGDQSEPDAAASEERVQSRLRALGYLQ